MMSGDDNQLAVVAIVDDDASIRRALSRLMRACGFVVETYASAEEFLASAVPQRIACLLLDLQMSGMTGLELLDLLATRGSPPPTIIITAHADDALFARVRSGGTTVLRKPLETDELVASVGRATGRDLGWAG